MSFDNEGGQSVQAGQLEGDDARSAKGSKKWIGAVAAVAVVAAVTVGGVAVVNAMGGGGAQPEDVLPGTALAFVKLDLNPSAGQKLAVFRLAAKFPDLNDKVTSQDTSIKESVFGSIFTGPTDTSGLGLDYKKDVEPWLGDRIGVGVFPDIDGDKMPEVGAAIAFTDRDAAKKALDTAIANAAKGAGAGKVQKKTGYAFTDNGYVILSDTTAHASALVKAGEGRPLTGSVYTQDVKSLGSDQIGVVWVNDLSAVAKAFPTDSLKGSPFAPLSESLKAAGDPKKASGRVIMGLHADPSFIEVTAKAVGVKNATPAVKVDPADGGAMIASFPTDVFGGFTATGLGKSIGVLYTSLTAKGDPMGVKPMLGGIGITTAAQIETLLGTETGLVVGGTIDAPEFAVRTQSVDPAAASTLARQLLPAAQSGTPAVTVSTVEAPKGIVVGMGSGLVGAISSPSGSKLGDTAAFKQVMPGFDRADFALFVNLGKVVPLVTKDNPKAATALGPFTALGMTASGKGDSSTVRFRLAVR